MNARKFLWIAFVLALTLVPCAAQEAKGISV